MLALVTCHISPPSIWYGKKIEFLAPDFPADSLQFFRAHGFTGAVRQMPTAMRNPFAWTNVSSGKNACFAIWPRVGICPIISYLWMVDLVMRFFSCGASLWRSSTSIQSKKVQPLEFYFWHVRLGLFQVTFFWLVKLNMCGCTLLQGQMHFQQKNICFVIWARIDTKFLNSSHHVLSVDDWPGDATFFPVGPTFEDHPQVFSQKRSSPLNFIFDTCASASWSHLFWLVKLNICGCTLFARTNVFSAKKTCVLQFGRALTQNSWIRPIMSYLWMIGLEMRLFSCGPAFEDYPLVFSQKKVQPLGFYFWHLRLGLFKSLFWLVKLNMCVCTLLQGQLYFQQKKHVFCNLGARWHKILEFVPSCPISGWLAWWCDFFSCGANLWRSSASIQSKKVQPLEFYFWHVRLGLLKSPFFVGEGEHMWLHPFAKSCKESYPLN